LTFAYGTYIINNRDVLALRAKSRAISPKEVNFMIKYESMYILKPDMGGRKERALVKRFSDIVTSNGGEIESVDEWGKKRLAYPIQYINDGYYVLMTFSAPAELPAELERNYRISDDILRYIVVNLDKK
jgi:small subunit ribosomal protein S6